MHWKSHNPSKLPRFWSILSAAMTGQPSNIVYHESEPTALSITEYSRESPAIMTSMRELLDRGISELNVAFASKGKDTFHPFSKLPTEIRLQIWQQAIDALPGRIIDITPVTHENESGYDILDKFISHRACPRLAGVNSEARAAVFKVYTPLFPPETKHCPVTAYLEKDTVLLSTVFSASTRHIGFRWHQDLFFGFSEALGEEKCREFRTLALETETNWQWGRWSMDGGGMCPWLPVGGKTTTLRQIFPNIEKVVYVPLIKGSANEHDGELEFVGEESGTWSTGVKRYARVAARLLWWRVEDLKFEFMQFGIVGGPKKRQWDPVRRNVYWRRMTEEETRDKEAKLSIIEERRRLKIEAKDGKVAVTELVGALRIS